MDFGQVASAAMPQLVDDRLQRQPGIKHVIDEQEAICSFQPGHQIVDCVNPHRLRSCCPLASYDEVRIANVIALLPVKLQHLLNRDPDGRAPTPHADQKRRPEPASDHLHAQLQRVAQQGFGTDEDFSMRAAIYRISVRRYSEQFSMAAFSCSNSSVNSGIG